jgi:hypothetical protein
VQGTPVSLEPPAGLSPSPRFAGFQAHDEDVSILVTELPSPLAAATAGFTDAQRLEAQRMRLLRQDKVTLPGGEAIIFVFTQRQAGIEYHKQILALGGPNRTILVVATCDQDLAAKWEAPLRKSLLTVTVSAAAAPSPPPFRIEPQGRFREIPSMTGSATFTLDGQHPLPGPDAPRFIVTRSVAPAAGPLREFAERRARALPGMRDLEVKALRDVRIDDLEGVELEGAQGNNILFQIVLREADGPYYLLVGLAPAAETPAYLATFRAMSASFRRNR